MRYFHRSYAKKGYLMCSPCDDCLDATAYLGGPMRGLPFFNFPAFDSATADLRLMGWEIHSPAEKDRDVLDISKCPTGSNEELDAQSFSLAGALAWDFARISESSVVIFLPGWEKSTGCSWEATVAYALSKPVLLYPDLEQADLPEVVTNPTRAVANAVSDFIDSCTPEEVARDAEGYEIHPTYSHVRGVDGPGAYERIWDGPLEPFQGVSFLDKKPPTIAEAFAQLDAVSQRGAVVPIPPLGEIRVTDPTTGGQKGSKPERFDLIPADVMEELARHYGRGCQKYADRNWEKGYKWSLSVAALERHLNLWKQGHDIDFDPEIGQFPHLVAVIWHACALLAFEKRGIGTDDRS